jgi:hypothetical protein
MHVSFLTFSLCSFIVPLQLRGSTHLIGGAAPLLAVVVCNHKRRRAILVTALSRNPKHYVQKIQLAVLKSVTPKLVVSCQFVVYKINSVHSFLWCTDVVRTSFSKTYLFNESP